MVFIGIGWVFIFWFGDLGFGFWILVDYGMYGMDEGFYIFDWYYMV